MNDRAIVYRRKYNIPRMGHRRQRAGDGLRQHRRQVRLRRRVHAQPGQRHKEFYGEFLINAQGEDVVAGVRTPEPVAQLKKQMPAAYAELDNIRKTLESTSRTCRTSSSRSRTARCSCSRPATASAPPSPR
jgi:pyruvate,orthophosphate dikinase